MQKIFAYIGGSILTIALLFGGGFLTGRITANKQPDETGSGYSDKISSFIEFTRSYYNTRAEELRQRENSITSRESALTERENYIREATSRVASDRGDLKELAGILDQIEQLSEVH